MCPKACVAGDNGKLYMCLGKWSGDTRERHFEDSSSVAYWVGWCDLYDNMAGKVNGDWVFKLWCVPLGLHVGFDQLHVTKVESPKEYSGYVQSSSYLEIWKF